MTSNWAEVEFGQAKLGDPRRTKRLVKIASARGLRPEASLPNCFQSEAELDAMYDFCDNPNVQSAAILESHYRATTRRLAKCKIVLAVQDTTYVDYSKHPKTEGLGILSDNKHHGFLLHSTLAVTPQRVPLGLMGQQIIYRWEEDYGKKQSRKKRPTEDKESQKWLNSLEATSKFQADCTETLIVNVGDRESDVYDAFLYAKELEQAVLIRAAWNRAVAHEEKYLWQRLETRMPCEQQLGITVKRRVGKESRSATLTVRHDKVTLKPPVYRKAEKLPNLEVYAVLAREESPPLGEKAVEWLLLTTVAINNVDEAIERIAWYGCRWMIEIYHKVLKSGCKIEERQFEKAERLERYVAIDSVVAWHILGLTFQSRETPEMNCEAFLEVEEWQALYCFTKKTTQVPKQAPTLREATLWIAKLGGFLGRKHDGHPGITVIWRGFQRLADIVAATQIFNHSNNMVI